MTEEQQMQVIENQGLIGIVIKKFPFLSLPYEDIASIGMIGLCKGIKTFNTNKNIKLSTYASRCIYNELLMYMRDTNSDKRKANNNTISLNVPIEFDDSEVELIDYIKSDKPDILDEIIKNDTLEKVYNAINILPNKNKDMLCYYFGIMGYDKKTQKEIANAFGLTQSTINKTIMRTIRILKGRLHNIK